METTLKYKHIAVCPSAGVAHLNPFLRLASMLASSSDSCKVTLVIIRPTLSTAEDNQINALLSTHPHIALSEVPAVPPNGDFTGDPFVLQYDTVSRSSHRLKDHLLTSLSPRPSAVFSDIMLAAGLHEPLSQLGIDSYTLIITSARCFCLMVNRLHESYTKGVDVEVPGLPATIPAAQVPGFLFDPNHIMSRISDNNCRHLPHAKGVVLCSFDFMEPHTISALQTGQVWADLPPFFPIGPLHPLPSHQGRTGLKCITWLDKQAPKSVVFVCFGSRSAMSKCQIKELGEGLLRSGVKFLWVIKTTIVDKDDTEELKEVLGELIFERTAKEDQGLVVREWVNQEEILSHRAVAGFLTHSGWTSLMESAQRRMPLLLWPLGGDQPVNAAVAKDVGLGIWETSWVGDKLVIADEVADKVKELMSSESFRASASIAWEEAKKAWDVQGSSRLAFNKISM